MKATMVLACLLAAAIAGGPTPARQTQQEQKQEKEKGKKKAEEKPAEGGLFGGVKAVTSMKKSEETELTASAGAKGVGEGKAIGKVPVTQADRDKVARMASAMPSPAEMKTFLEQGKLATERKGGRQ